MKYNVTGCEAVKLKNNHILLLHKRGHADNTKDKYEIYNPEKNEFYFTSNTTHAPWASKSALTLDNKDILVIEGSSYIYKTENNSFEKINTSLPNGRLMVQLDGNSYLNIEPVKNYSYGYVYDIKHNTEIPVKNHINRTWTIGTYPQAVLLDNGNVLILGIKSKEIDYSKSRKSNKKHDKYSAYIYDKKKNEFYEIPAPPYPVYSAGIVNLKNGSILIAGGYYRTNSMPVAKSLNKIQIYKYKH